MKISREVAVEVAVIKKELSIMLKLLDLFGSPGRTRTSDRVVNSHLLYRLSYRGIIWMHRNKIIRRV
jgi:hypothetical protein